MDDWEQPSTTAVRRGFGDVNTQASVEVLQQQLSDALARISALEDRVNQLESRSQPA